MIYRIPFRILYTLGNKVLFVKAQNKERFFALKGNITQSHVCTQ